MSTASLMNLYFMGEHSQAAAAGVWRVLTQDGVGLCSEPVPAGPSRRCPLGGHQGRPGDRGGTSERQAVSPDPWPQRAQFHLAGECIGELVRFFSLRMSWILPPPLLSHSTLKSSTFRFWWDEAESSLKLKAVRGRGGKLS